LFDPFAAHPVALIELSANVFDDLPFKAGAPHSRYIHQKGSNTAFVTNQDTVIILTGNAEFC